VEAEVKLKILGGGTRKSIELLRRKNDTNVYTMTRVWTKKYKIANKAAKELSVANGKGVQ
jgi:hypothetical protein